MASTKNNFLNAKPVSKLGGKSGGVRKPGKPYQKPSSTSGKPKLQSKSQKPAAKPTPKPAAPTVKGPVPRPGLQNRGGISAKDLLPNSARRDGNLPKAGAQALRSRTQGPKAPTASKPPQVVTKPVTRSGPVKGPVPPKGSSPATLPNSRRAGVNLPQAGARAERTAQRVMDLKKEAAAKASAPKPSAPSNASGLARGAGMAGRVAGAFGTALAIPAAIKNIADVAERNRQWDAYKERMGMNKPQSKPPSSSTPGRRTGSNNRVANLSVPTSSAGSRAGAAAGTRTRTRNTSPSNSGPDWRSRVGSQDVNTLRQGQNDAIRSYNNKPTAARPSQSAPSQSAPSSRPAASRPSTPAAPAKPASPAAPKDRRVSAATANRESGNYGTSRTNNPMIDDAMKARMRQREDATGVGPVKDGARYGADVKNNTKGVGPIKDGERYASNVKPSTSTPGKKKEDETKTMSVAERMRRRRAGLA